MAKEVNELDVIRLYTEERMTLRHVSETVGIDHHRVRRILEKNGVEITRRNSLKAFSEEHRRKISEAAKGRISWSRGKKMTEDHKRKNMIGHLKRSTTLIHLERYVDFDRLKFLNNVIARHRKHFNDDEKYLLYLDKFYFNEAFNKIYDLWIHSGKNKWMMPSIDHINSKANGGDFELDNLRFITWFENRAKAEMDLEVWDLFKKETNTTSNLFIESILKTTN
jgi:hypothetical protein